MEKNYNKIGLVIDRNNRKIFTSRSKKHYVVHADDLRKYEFYHNRYLFSFTLLLLITILNVYAAIGVGLVSLVVLEFLFSKVFLVNNCQELESYVPSDTKNQAERSTVQKVILGILYIALGVLLIVYTISTGVEDQVTFVSYGIAALAIFLGLQSFVRLLFKQN